MKGFALLATLCPALAVAAECEHGQDRSLALDVEGVRTARIEINAQALRLGPCGIDNPRFTARACASDPALFDQLTLTQQRQGSVLVIRAERDG